jgi:hypothetical protein
MEFLLLYGALSLSAVVAFWGVVILLLLLIGFWSEKERGIASLFVTAVVFGSYISLSKIDPMSVYNALSFWKLVAYIASYLAIGAGWSVFSWRLLNINNRNSYLSQKKEYLESGKTDSEWMIKVASDYHLRKISVQSVTTENKERLSNWIAFWPASMIWRVMSDWIWNVVKLIREVLDKIYTAVGADVYKDVK